MPATVSRYNVAAGNALGPVTAQAAIVRERTHLQQHVTHGAGHHTGQYARGGGYRGSSASGHSHAAQMHAPQQHSSAVRKQPNYVLQAGPSPSVPITHTAHTPFAHPAYAGHASHAPAERDSDADMRRRLADALAENDQLKKAQTAMSLQQKMLVSAHTDRLRRAEESIQTLASANNWKAGCIVRLEREVASLRSGEALCTLNLPSHTTGLGVVRACAFRAVSPVAPTDDDDADSLGMVKALAEDLSAATRRADALEAALMATRRRTTRGVEVGGGGGSGAGPITIPAAECKSKSNHSMPVVPMVAPTAVVAVARPVQRAKGRSKSAAASLRNPRNYSDSETSGTRRRTASLRRFAEE